MLGIVVPSAVLHTANLLGYQFSHIWQTHSPILISCLTTMLITLVTFISFLFQLQLTCNIILALRVKYSD